MNIEHRNQLRTLRLDIMESEKPDHDQRFQWARAIDGMLAEYDHEGLVRSFDRRGDRRASHAAQRGPDGLPLYERPVSHAAERAAVLTPTTEVKAAGKRLRILAETVVLEKNQTQVLDLVASVLEGL